LEVVNALKLPNEHEGKNFVGAITSMKQVSIEVCRIATFYELAEIILWLLLLARLRPHGEIATCPLIMAELTFNR